MIIVPFLLCEISNYWSSVLQNALGCAAGSVAGIWISIWIYRNQNAQHEKELTTSKKQVENNLWMYFSKSLADIITSLEQQRNSIEEFIKVTKADPLNRSLLTIVPIHPIKRIIENSSLDEILIAHTNRFQDDPEATKKFSQILSTLDYLYLELDYLPGTFKRSMRADHKRRVEFSKLFKFVWNSIGKQLVNDPGGTEPATQDFIKVWQAFEAERKDPSDLRYAHDQLIIPMLRISSDLVGSGNMLFIDLANAARDAKDLFNDILIHIENFNDDDLLPISEKIQESIDELKRLTANF